MHDFNEMLLLIYNVEEMKMQFIDERLLFLMMNRLYLEIKMDLTKDLLMILELLHFGEDGILELLHLQPPTSTVQFQLKYMCPTTTNNNNY